MRWSLCKSGQKSTESLSNAALNAYLHEAGERGAPRAPSCRTAHATNQWRTGGLLGKGLLFLSCTDTDVFKLSRAAVC